MQIVLSWHLDHFIGALIINIVTLTSWCYAGSVVSTCNEYMVHIVTYIHSNVKQKSREMFETQKSRNKTSSGEIWSHIRTNGSHNLGQDQVSGGVSVLCWHAAPVANWCIHLSRTFLYIWVQYPKCAYGPYCKLNPI